MHTLVSASPVFFDSLFPAYQSTTPESVISDYRNRTHNSNGTARSNVEFYAEIVGKLIGTIRDGFSTLLDDVKTKQHKTENRHDSSNQQSDEVHTMLEILRNHTASKITKNGSGSNTMTNDSGDEIQSTMSPSSLRLHLLAAVKNDTVVDGEKSGAGGGATQQTSTTAATSSWSSVIQKIAKTSLKRNDIESESNFSASLVDEDDEKFDFFDDDDDLMEMPKEESHTESPSLLLTLYERHRQRKQKLIDSLCRIFSSENDDGEELTLEPRMNREAKLTFAIIRGNATVAQVTPKQFLGVFHRGSDEHAEFQMRAKRMLQEAFYKYARIYLRARKGYKDARNLNRHVREISSSVTMLSSQELSSEARSGVRALESFAILLLEILGAFTALAFGAVNQFQSSYPFH